MLKYLFHRLKPGVHFLLHHSPPALERRAIESLLRVMLDEAREAGELDFMEGKTLVIRLLDFQRQWIFRGISGRIQVLAENGNADACISGNAKEFILLASRREDPDTLFFQRRLNIEGDIELSLAVKNMIDGLEPHTLPKPLQQLLQHTGAWAEKGYLP